MPFQLSKQNYNNYYDYGVSDVYPETETLRQKIHER